MLLIPGFCEFATFSSVRRSDDCGRDSGVEVGDERSLFPGVPAGKSGFDRESPEGREAGGDVCR